MTRSMLALLLAGLLGCEESGGQAPPSAPKARSQAVVAPATQHSAGGAARGTPRQLDESETAPVKHTRTQALCAGQLEQPGKALSRLTLGREVADGEQALPEALPLGNGQWTWLNFWAAWCVPCREEIPRLKNWEKQLNANKPRLRLVFISLDDDARQLVEFLARQPAQGLRRTYWIKEGDAREKWFGAINMDPDPELPAHVLIDPTGLARCIVNGAVEDSDLPMVRRIVGG